MAGTKISLQPMGAILSGSAFLGWSNVSVKIFIGSGDCSEGLFAPRKTVKIASG